LEFVNMHTLEPVNRSIQQPNRNTLPAGARAVTGSTHATNAFATMEVQ
jgi:hypothetical protein